MRPIRVLILVSSFAIEGPLGGVARFVVELSRALDKRQVTPMLGAIWDYHTPFDQQWLRQINHEGIEAFIAADWREEAPYASCVAALRGFWHKAPRPVDIIHSHGEFNDIAALLLRRRLGARATVRTVHNEFEWAKRPHFGKFFPNLVYPFAFDAELGVAQQVVDNLNRRPLARLRRRPAQRMYNSLNFQRFAAPRRDPVVVRQKLGLPPVAPVIGTVGRLAPQKGYHVLLAAVPRVLEALPNAIFLVVGSGMLAAPLQQQAHDLGIAQSVRFTGSRNDVEDLYTVMDLFVSSSLWEGLPTVVMEAMAAGVPVVATRVSGNTELVQHGETGLLVPPHDPDMLAEAMLEQLRDRPRARAMSARAKQHAEAHFSVREVAKQHIELYRRLLRAPS